MSGRDLTRAELDAALRSLRAVGSPYDFIAAHVETDNLPHLRDEDLPTLGLESVTTAGLDVPDELEGVAEVVSGVTGDVPATGAFGDVSDLPVRRVDVPRPVAVVGPFVSAALNHDGSLQAVS